jgi:hypothetical protein
MKKTFLIAAVATTVVLTALSSCKKYEVSEYSVKNLQKAVVTGIVTTSFGVDQEDYAPSGTVLTFKIANSEYGVTGNEAGYYVVTSTVGDNGKYSVEIPLREDGNPVNVLVTSNSFIHSYKESDDISFDRKYVFNNSGFTVSQSAGNFFKFSFSPEILIKDLYGNNITPTSTVTFSGKLSYLSSYHYQNGLSDTLPIPSGTTIKATIRLTSELGSGNGFYREERTITVGTNGSYSLSVPMIESGRAVVLLEGYKDCQYTVYNNSNEVISNYWYRYELSASEHTYEYPRVCNFMFSRISQQLSY